MANSTINVNTNGINSTAGNANALDIQTGGVTAISVDASQNVGIGGTPTQKLDVVGSIRAQAAATQDAVQLSGRAGGTGSYEVTLTPTTLSADRTVTLPNANIDFTTGLGVAQGGTGATTLTANNVILGNGASAVQFVAPGTSGNLLTSNGTTWTSAAAPSGYAGASGQVFTGNGTFTIPTGITKLQITVVGGGGAGSATAAGQSPAGGGGAGGSAISYLTGLTPGNTLSVTVGGAGGTSSVASGTQTITTISGSGGSAGSQSNGNNAGVGGNGGSGSGGSINLTGGPGQSGTYSGGGGTGGAGGNSIFGGGGKGGAGGNGCNPGLAGGAGATYGAGGGAGGAGGTGGGSGGAGAAGVVIFDW